MSLSRLLFVFLSFATVVAANASDLPKAPRLQQAEQCTPDNAWRSLRESFGVEAQIIAKCMNSTGHFAVLILTAPPPHITRAKSADIVKALFQSNVMSVERRRMPLGFDGWVEDLVVQVAIATPSDLLVLDNDSANLAVLAFGSSYKAEVLEVFTQKSYPQPVGLPNFSVGKNNVIDWLLGPHAVKLSMTAGGAISSVQDLAAGKKFGTYYTSQPGLVVSLIPRASSGTLNGHIEDLRRFAVDTDAVLGAVALSDSVVGLIGRERTASLIDVPPLRLETIMLLAANRSAQLAQSYERTRAFAGKMLSHSQDLFGWDWAPILLSDNVVDTEFGSLLDFTDNMLKGWSESNKIDYKGFASPAPDHFPFGDLGAFKTFGGDSLTYNWNTAGLGTISSAGLYRIYTIRNTGSLPVSYLPEGIEKDSASAAKLKNAEDAAYAYFSQLRNPYLGRAVQYTALFQIFEAFDVRATPPQAQPVRTALMENVDAILAKKVTNALRRLSDSSSPTKGDLFLQEAYDRLGSDGKLITELKLPPKLQSALETARRKIASKLAMLTSGDATGQEALATALSKGFPVPPDFKDDVDLISEIGLPMVVAPADVMRDIVAGTEHNPVGWIKTPSVVVSHGYGSIQEGVGGHNIGGYATRVEIDASVPKGSIAASGTYENGRILRINPADENAEQDIVRVFDREAGLLDENMPNGTSAAERLLSQTTFVAPTERDIAMALGRPPSRLTRGAEQSVGAKPLGAVPVDATHVNPEQLQAAYSSSTADLVIAPSPPGYLIMRPRPIPAQFVTAPNATSMEEAVELGARDIATGPPPNIHPSIGFASMSKDDVGSILRSLEHRGKAVADAGGLPPFGGDRSLFSLASPDPDRPVAFHIVGETKDVQYPDRISEGGIWARIKTLLSGSKERVHAADGTTEQALADVAKLRPAWSEAKIADVDLDHVDLIGIPYHKGVLRVIGVDVPVKSAVDGNGSLSLKMATWFKKTFSGTEEAARQAKVREAFTGARNAGVEEVMSTYKNIMIEQYGALDFWIQVRTEGTDVIYVGISTVGDSLG